jgi:formate/nitrite transporter
MRRHRRASTVKNMADNAVKEVVVTESTVEPTAIVDAMVAQGSYKGMQANRTILVRAILSSMIFGAVTTFVGYINVQTEMSFLGALFFPAALVIVILLGLELVTSSMGVVPLAWFRGECRRIDVWRVIGVAIVGHVIGCAFFAVIFWATITSWGQVPFADLAKDAPVAQWLVELAEHKTLAYQEMGVAGGIGLVFLKAILCNWLVSMGGVMALTSRTTGGKITAIWLPIMVFFGLGYEHSVVNLFVIPAAMMVGAPISFGDWWLWNEIPVLVGNLVGASLFTGMGLWLAHRNDIPWDRDHDGIGTYHTASVKWVRGNRIKVEEIQKKNHAADTTKATA